VCVILNCSYVVCFCENLWLKTQKFWLYTRRQGFGQKSFFIGNSLTRTKIAQKKVVV